MSWLRIGLWQKQPWPGAHKPPLHLIYLLWPWQVTVPLRHSSLKWGLTAALCDLLPETLVTSLLTFTPSQSLGRIWTPRRPPPSPRWGAGVPSRPASRVAFPVSSSSALNPPFLGLSPPSSQKGLVTHLTLSLSPLSPHPPTPSISISPLPFSWPCTRLPSLAPPLPSRCSDHPHPVPLPLLFSSCYKPEALTRPWIASRDLGFRLWKSFIFVPRGGPPA